MKVCTFAAAITVLAGFLSAGTLAQEARPNAGQAFQCNVAGLKVNNASPDETARAVTSACVYSMALRNGHEADAFRALIANTNREFQRREGFQVEVPSRAETRTPASIVDIAVLEYADLTGKLPIRYRYSVLDEARRESWFISLGSYESITAMLHQSRMLKTDHRLFHLDGYRGSTHFLIATFEGEPSYEETKRLVSAFIRGDRFPLVIVMPAAAPAAR